MKYYLGIDGGGTKTEYMLADENSKTIYSLRSDGISYRQYSFSEIEKKVDGSIKECLRKSNVAMDSVACVCVGYPCFGESEVQDEKIRTMFARMFTAKKVVLVNDVEVGAAGALGLAVGIHVVAGTGAIAWGKNKNGTTLRCGGWLDYFGDEGSAYWLGRKAMQLFSRQADGRSSKSKLYEIIKAEFKLKRDMDFVDVMQNDYIPYREKVASLQLLLLEAAKKGDNIAKSIYEKAVMELCALVKTLKNRLELQDGFRVSYSGGMFQEKVFVRDRFMEEIKKDGGVVTAPKFSPVMGAIKLAIQRGREMSL